MVDLDLSLSAELKASLDGIAASVARQERYLAQAQEAMDHIPLDVPIMRSGTSNATGVAVISCGGPARGRQWQVRQLAVSGPTKGVVRLLALSVAPTSPYDMGLKDSTATRWPAPGFYSTHELVLQGGETLWVVVTGATASTTVHVNGSAEDYDLVAYRARLSL